MNKPKVLVWIAVGLFCVAWWAVFVSVLWFAALLSLSMVLGVVGHFIETDTDPDCGYGQTPFANGPHPAAAPVIDLNSRRPE